MASAGLPSPEAFIKLISQPLVLQSPLQVGGWASIIAWRAALAAPRCCQGASPNRCRLPRRCLPLQAVLELLFNALQAQGSSIGDLQGQQHEAQASVAAAVVALETRLAAHEAAAAAEHAEAQARLQDVEMRLHGASNLAGRQAALDEIASIIGVSVPEVCLFSCGKRSVGEEGGNSSSFAEPHIEHSRLPFQIQLHLRWHRRRATKTGSFHHRRRQLSSTMSQLPPPAWPTALSAPATSTAAAAPLCQELALPMAQQKCPSHQRSQVPCMLAGGRRGLRP